MLTFKDSDLAKIIKENLGVDVGAREFLPFSDVDQSIRDDVALLAKDELIIKGTPIIGMRYDCATGALHEVAKAERA
jgi:carbonic anhydrase